MHKTFTNYKFINHVLCKNINLDKLIDYNLIIIFMGDNHNNILGRSFCRNKVDNIFGRSDFFQYFLGKLKK